LFEEQLAAGTLAPTAVDRLAALLAEFHAQAPRADVAATFGSPEQRRLCALAALTGAQATDGGEELVHLQSWLNAEADRLTPVWAARRAQGAVRECHGDLHLANVVLLEDQVAAFDGIEFDPALRWIDVLDDAAFVLMDFAAHGRPDLGFRFLNEWLDRCGEHAGLPAMRFALVYRALVRAQVAALRGPAGADAARRYRQAALAWTETGLQRLFITHGLPGSGKTFASQRVLEQEQAIRLRSDVERKRLFGLGMLESSRAIGLDIYQAEAGQRTYAQLMALARIALQAGFSVVIDAAFLRRSEREQALALARELEVTFVILACAADMPVLRARLQARRGDASEADPAVLERLTAMLEPLAADEQAFACMVCGPEQGRLRAVSRPLASVP
jgi:predicted kinase